MRRGLVFVLFLVAVQPYLADEQAGRRGTKRVSLATGVLAPKGSGLTEFGHNALDWLTVGAGFSAGPVSSKEQHLAFAPGLLYSRMAEYRFTSQYAEQRFFLVLRAFPLSRWPVYFALYGGQHQGGTTRFQSYGFLSLGLPTYLNGTIDARPGPFAGASLGYRHQIASGFFFGAEALVLYDRMSARTNLEFRSYRYTDLGQDFADFVIQREMPAVVLFDKALPAWFSSPGVLFYVGFAL